MIDLRATLTQTELDESLDDLNDVSAAEVRAEDDASIVAYDPSTGTEVAALADVLHILLVEIDHISFIFPEDTDETVVFTAGGTNHVFGAWAEIVDNNAVTLTSKVVIDMHISSVMVEDASVKDKVYIVEIAYGDSKTVVTRQRYMSSDAKVGTTQQIRVRGRNVPAGKTIYYRAKCETADATIQVHLRYHLH